MPTFDMIFIDVTMVTEGLSYSDISSWTLGFDHRVLIDKIIEMGVNRNIIPWVYDFLGHRQQCVRYNCDLSDYVFLSAGVPQDTQFGPIGFHL